MMRKLLILLLVLALSACAPKHTDPAIIGPFNDTAAQMVAEQDARTIGGLYYHVTCCGSMLPLIKNGDYVLVRKVPLTDSLIGRVVAYRPKWNGGKVVIHRMVGTISGGYIGEGDARKASNGPIKPEVWEPITDETFIGEVITVYSVES